MMSKTRMIIKYMSVHTGITQMDAYELCKATRLGAIIFDLKKRGYEIETVILKQGRTRYAEYRMSGRCKEYVLSNSNKPIEEWLNERGE